MALASPATPAQHTINIVPAPPVTYSSAEIQAAKDTACKAWEDAALATAVASKVRVGVAQDPSSIGDRFDARATEKRVGIAQISFLRTQIGAATPDQVVTPIEDWIASEVDRLHFVNMRDWPASRAALDRGNDLVDVIVPACGLR